jgi:hypothetical protein
MGLQQASNTQERSRCCLLTFVHKRAKYKATKRTNDVRIFSLVGGRRIYISETGRENIGTCKKRKAFSLWSSTRFQFSSILLHIRRTHNSTVSNIFAFTRGVHKHEWCRKQQQKKAFYIVCYAQHTFFNATSDYSRIFFRLLASEEKGN